MYSPGRGVKKISPPYPNCIILTISCKLTLKGSWEITPQNLKEFESKSQSSNILFFIGSNACTFCKALKPTWESLALYVKNSFNDPKYRQDNYISHLYTQDIILAHIDGDDYPELVTYFGVKSYPSIFYIANGFFYTYDKFSP